MPNIQVFPDCSPESILREVVVRPIFSVEREQWDRRIREHHYLGLHSLVGKTLRYVAIYKDIWLALMGWQGAALKCRPRDIWIGWSRIHQYQRLHLIANNSRFLILPWIRIHNLASRILSLNLKRLSDDWHQIHGHPVVLAETFVDRSRFTGACYRAANWKMLGQTRGYSKSGQRYSYHKQPKEILVYPLHSRVPESLRHSTPDPSWEGSMQRISISTKQMEDLHGRLRRLPECRKSQGIRHRFATIITISIAAMLAGARGYAAIAEWGGRLHQHQLKRLRARYNKKAQRFEAPSEPTIRRVLQAADAQAIDHSLGEWMLSVTGENDPIAVDGKTLRGARREDGSRVHLLSAISQNIGVTIAQREVDRKTNEIPELRNLLEPIDVKGRVISADAMHTQEDTARYIVKEKEADYIFTVKGNQPTLLDNIRLLQDEDFFPGS